MDINIGVALDDSDSATDAIANFPLNLEEGKTYVVVASGIVGGNPGFDLSIFDMGLSLMPNPASDYTTLTFDLEKESQVNVLITNQLGQIVKSDYLGIQAKGFFQTDLNLNGLTSGNYFISVQTDSTIETKPLIIFGN